MINEIGKIYAKPWGTYQTLAINKNHQVKILIINPQGCLSLQKHAKRCEHWVVVAGTPTITIDDLTKNYQVNDHVFIPTGIKHRIENLTDTQATIIEIQFGTYLGEDDIVRLADIYNRS